MKTKVGVVQDNWIAKIVRWGQSGSGGFITTGWQAWIEDADTQIQVWNGRLVGTRRAAFNSLSNRVKKQKTGDLAGAKS